MADPKTGTVKLHRVLATTPEKLYRAFLNAEALAKWLPPYGFTCKVDHLEAKVGGTFRMSFTNFTSQNSHAFGGEYLELVPNERIRYTDRFDDPNLPGEMHVTVQLKAVSAAPRCISSRAAFPPDPGGKLLPGLAAVADAVGAGGRAGHSGLTEPNASCGALRRPAGGY